MPEPRTPAQVVWELCKGIAAVTFVGLLSMIGGGLVVGLVVWLVYVIAH